MTDRIRWGILSTARIGRRRVVPAIQESRNGAVVAVASRSLEAAESFAAEWNIPRTYGSYDGLLADPNVDAIYNPLPNHLHAEWSIKAAQAGIPVLCEKPLASDIAEAKAIVDAFALRQILFAEAFMYRFHPQTVRVKQMVDEGLLGQLQVMQAAFTFRLGPERADDIRLKKEMGGGGLLDVGCYCVNLMRLIAGAEPVEAKAVAHFGPTGVDEWLAGTLRFPSDVLGHFDCGLQTHFANFCDLRGTEGRILLESVFAAEPDQPRAIRHWRGDHYEEIAIPPANHYTLMVEDFADALIEGRPPRFPPQDAVENMRVLDRLLKSAGG